MKRFARKRLRVLLRRAFFRVSGLFVPPASRVLALERMTRRHKHLCERSRMARDKKEWHKAAQLVKLMEANLDFYRERNP